MDKIKTVFIDTNIPFSASIVPKGRRAHFLFDNLAPNFEIIPSDYVLTELEDALRKNIKRHKDFRKAWKHFKKKFNL